MRLISFSDGHIGEYGEGSIDQSTGLNTRLLDTLRVWDWVRELAHSKRADVVVFAGDRFKPHKPPAWMRDLADERLYLFRKEEIPVVCLLGNHDMYDKAGRWNSYKGVQVWNDDEKIAIFDKPGILELDEAILHFLPYGYRSLENEISKSDTNILFFHDAVIGHSRDGKYISKAGIARENIDREEFSLILGGHIHLRQDLHFHNAPALHIGTPLERIQDGNQGSKGALIIDIVDKEANVQFVESPLPKVLEFEKSWNDDIEEVLDFGVSVEGNIVLLVLSHTSAPTSIRKELEKRIREKGASSVKVRMQARVSVSHNVNAEIEQRVPIGDQLISYVKQIDDDSELLNHLVEIRRRGEAS